jgi:hypothetical protein
MPPAPPQAPPQTALPTGWLLFALRKRVVVALVSLALGLTIFSLSLAAHQEAGLHLTPASVSVRGYYRRDGTYVRPYHRRPPGGARHDAPYEARRELSRFGMLLGVGIALAPLLLFLPRQKRPHAGSTPPEATGQAAVPPQRPTAPSGAGQGAEQRGRAEQERNLEEERRRQQAERARREQERQKREAEAAEHARQERAGRQRTERMEQWKRSGMPCQWVLEHLDGWDKPELAALFTRLRATPWWPLDVEEVVDYLEGLRDELRAERERQRPKWI